jgi:hypothetical protein
VFEIEITADDAEEAIKIVGRSRIVDLIADANTQNNDEDFEAACVNILKVVKVVKRDEDQ